MTYKKYSKSSSFYLNTKKDFFETNDNLLKQALKYNQIYKEQNKRENCKICCFNLGNDYDIQNHNIGYIFCKKCNHLNGIYEDTENFIQKMYLDNEGRSYSKHYIDKNFKKRAEDIYLPKIDFLLKNISLKHPKILDLGCGGGHFVFAGLVRNCDIKGIDVGKKLIEFGNSQIFNHLKEKNRLKCKSEEQIFKTIENSDSQILTAMGVIEHLREPHKFFDVFKKSKIEFLYYSVPMFSMSVIFENIFKKVFPRQLSAGHTHLFTEGSVAKMNNLIGIKSIAEWRFGTDSMDLFRSFNVMLKKNKTSKKTIQIFNEEFLKIIDSFQEIMDKNHFCSEIHLLGKKTN